MATLDKSKKTGLIFIIIAIILAVIVAGLSYYLISGVTNKTPVLVLNKELQKGDPINKSMFKTEYVPTASIIEGTISVEADLSGYIAAIPLMPGEVLKKNQIIKLSENNKEIPLLSARLKAMDNPNLVAGEIPVDSIKGMISGMKSSDKISIVNVYKNDKKELISETVIPCADVIGIKSGEDGSAIMIALTHEQSRILAASRDKGKIYAYLLPYGITKEEVDTVVKKEEYKTLDSVDNGTESETKTENY